MKKLFPLRNLKKRFHKVMSKAHPILVINQILNNQSKCYRKTKQIQNQLKILLFQLSILQEINLYILTKSVGKVWVLEIKIISQEKEVDKVKIDLQISHRLQTRKNSKGYTKKLKDFIRTCSQTRNLNEIRKYSKARK